MRKGEVALNSVFEKCRRVRKEGAILFRGVTTHSAQNRSYSLNSAVIKQNAGIGNNPSLHFLRVC